MVVIALVGLQAAAGWNPPAQAAWSGDRPPVEVHLQAHPVSMRGKAEIDVDLVGTGDGFTVSPFLQPTRGIAFEVMTLAGIPVSSAEPMIGSPPPPPLAPDQLIPVPKAKTYHVVTAERATTLFPGPGRYKVRAQLHFFDFPSDPVNHATLASDTITVDVGK